jgi:Tol biopolymer transport system component
LPFIARNFNSKLIYPSVVEQGPAMKAKYRKLWGILFLCIVVFLLIPWQSVMAEAGEQPSAPQSQDDPPPDDEAFENLRNTPIVFASDRSGNFEIYLMKLDGSEFAQLTDNSAEDADPEVSPDGSKIVFTSRRNGTADIYQISAVGSEMAQYTDWPSDEWHPTWSPEGPEIAFISNIGADPEIYILDADGNSRQLTDNEYYDANPDWSPNG